MSTHDYLAIKFNKFMNWVFEQEEPAIEDEVKF